MERQEYAGLYWCSGCEGYCKVLNIGVGVPRCQPCDPKKLEQLEAHTSSCNDCKELFEYASVVTNEATTLRMANKTKEERHHIHQQCDTFCPELSHRSIKEQGQEEKKTIAITRGRTVGSIALTSLNISRRVGKSNIDQSEVLPGRKHTNGEKMAVIALGYTGREELAGNVVFSNIIGENGNGVHADNSTKFFMYILEGTFGDGTPIPKTAVKFCRRWNLNGMVLGRVYANGPYMFGAPGCEAH